MFVEGKDGVGEVTRERVGYGGCGEGGLEGFGEVVEG